MMIMMMIMIGMMSMLKCVPYVTHTHSHTHIRQIEPRQVATEETYKIINIKTKNKNNKSKE